MLAWLNTPADTERNSQSRRVRFGRIVAGMDIPEPPSWFFIDYLGEIGYMQHGGGALTWQEIKAWSDMTGVKLCSYDARFLRRLSAIYSKSISEYNGKPVSAPAFKE